MLIVALTGGIATGKSTVSEALRQLGCPIIDADQIARRVVEPTKPAWKAIVKHFGSEVLLPDRKINRQALGSIIFNSKEKRVLLNSCTQIPILHQALWDLIVHFFHGEHVVVLDFPWLYESQMFVHFTHRVIVVACSTEVQLQRLMQRNSLTEDKALKRINAQMSLEEKKRQATYVINNDGSLEDTKRQVEKLYKDLRRSRMYVIIRLFLGLSAVIILLLIVNLLM